MTETKKNTRSLALFIPVCLLLAGPLISSEQGPKIIFQEEIKDFGKVNQGDVLTHIFVFTNQGNENLEIKKVDATCGCTAAILSEKNIAPGKQGQIKITLNTRNLRQKSSKYVYVESNDPSSPRKRLTVSADINVPPSAKIVVTPYTVDAGVLLQAEDLQAQTKIRNTGERELTVECSHRSASFLSEGKQAVFPLKIAPGKEKTLDIKISTSNKKGVIREYVLLKTNDPSRKSLSVVVNSYVISKNQLQELFEKYRSILR